eukprot:Tamp_05014.p1 GENE.Tamp_05014~~Tamp_05014.p1  ORF type:complete len:385 (-),score=78.35 Tamp_05014:1570-2724(-)
MSITMYTLTIPAIPAISISVYTLQALGLHTRQGDRDFLLKGVIDVAAALYQQASIKGYTQGRRPQALATAVVVLGLHMELMSRSQQKPTLDAIRDKACQVLSVADRTIKDRIKEMQDLLLAAAADAQLPWKMQKRNLWIHGKDFLLHFCPAPMSGEDARTQVEASSSTRMEPPSRKRDLQSEASAQRVLQWAHAAQHRAALEGSGAGANGSDVPSTSGSLRVTSSPPLPPPVPLEPRDDPATQALIEMRSEGMSLETIQPQMLVERQQRAKLKRARAESEQAEPGRAGGAGGYALEIDEEDFREGGEYLFSEREVAERKQVLDEILPDGCELAAAEARKAKLARKQRAARARPGGGGGAASKQAIQSDKVDHAKLKELMEKDEL